MKPDTSDYTVVIEKNTSFVTFSRWYWKVFKDKTLIAKGKELYKYEAEDAAKRVIYICIEPPAPTKFTYKVNSKLGAIDNGRGVYIVELVEDSNG